MYGRATTEGGRKGKRSLLGTKKYDSVVFSCLFLVVSDLMNYVFHLCSYVYV